MSGRVLVAGAGPVGLTTALALGRAGFDVTVFERVDAANGGRNTSSRAATIHPPTIEIVEELGAADDLLARGKRGHAIAWFDRKRLAARLDMSAIASLTRHPYRVQYEQGWLTAVMVERLAAMPNVRVVTGTEVIGARNEGDTAILTVRDASGARDERGDFAIGADGSRSAVRESLGIGFKGTAYGSRSLRLMTHEDPTSLVPGLEPVSYVYDGDRSVSLLAQSDCWRIVFRVPSETSDADALEPAYIDRQIRGFFDVGPQGLSWFHADVYGTARRLATTYRAGRVLLAGDAAHITNTRGGMNMNCGIHDAYALAVALVRISRGAPLDATLDEYAASRLDIAEEKLIPRTDRNVTASGADRLRELAAIGADPGKAREFLLRASMLDMAPDRGFFA